MIEIAAVNRNGTQVPELVLTRNTGAESIDRELKGSMPFPREAAIAACLQQVTPSNATLYRLPPEEQAVSQALIGDVLKKIENLRSFQQGETLKPDVRMGQDNPGSIESDEKLVNALAALSSLSAVPEQSVLCAEADGNVSPLERTLDELAAQLFAMQGSHRTPEPRQLLAINAALVKFDAALLKSNGGASLSLSQAYMEVTRLSAWSLVQATAKHGDAVEEADMIDRLQDAIAIEAGIASVSVAALRAGQNGMIDIDASTKTRFEADLIRFLHIAGQLDTISQLAPNEAGSTPVPPLLPSAETASGEHGNVHFAAQQLDQWSRNGDIGIEALRLFMTALIRIRESMRESRQLALTLYSRRAADAAAALKKQGDDNWTKDILSAVGTIVSGALQITASVTPMLVKKYQRHKADKAAKSEKTILMKLSEELESTAATQAGKALNKNTQSAATRRRGSVAENTDGSQAGSVSKPDMVHLESSVRDDHVDLKILVKDSLAPRNAKMHDKTACSASSAEKTAAKSAPAAEDSALLTREQEQIEANKVHLESTKLQNYIMVGRGLGELAMGSFNIGSAYYGWLASRDGVEHYKQNAEMSKEGFQRDKWSAEAETMTRLTDQIFSTLTERLTRQTETTIKVIG